MHIMIFEGRVNTREFIRTLTNKEFIGEDDEPSHEISEGNEMINGKVARNDEKERITTDESRLPVIQL